MQAMLVVSLLMLAASGALTAPAQSAQRDVSELMPPAYNYLQPEVKVSLPETTTAAEIVETEATTAPPPSAELTNNGYAYRTVRHLKYRQRVRRDVSHLSSQYLPPSKTYLPPGQATMSMNADTPKDTQVYLPPEAEEAETETPAPIEAESEAPMEAEEAEKKEDEAPQDTAVLAADGYHYKQPAVAMPLPGEYLPPLQQEQTVAEGPEVGAVLTADGYQYRAIRRLKF